ncbi:MAG: hypothetical protein U9M89_02950, partial [Patescibacteria group bacterium]|nr:hypothetical protein [Patescibacteria group bacterium]
MTNWLDRFKFPTSDARKVGSWAFNILRPPVEDVAKIGRALPYAKSPFDAYKKTAYEVPKRTGSFFLDKLRSPVEDTYKKTTDYFEPTNRKISRIGQSFKGGVAGTMEGTGRGLEWLGFDKMKPFNDKVQEWKESLEVENQTFVEKFYSGIGSMSLFYAPGLGATKGASMVAKVSPKIAKLVGGGTMTAFEAMTEAGGTWQETKDLGLGEREADKRAEKVFWTNAALIGITNKLGFFGEHKKGLLRKLLMTSSMEGMQEFGQEVIQNVTMGRQWDLNAYEAGKIGFLIGGLFGAGDLTPSNQKQAANKSRKILGLSEKQSIKFIG